MPLLDLTAGSELDLRVRARNNSVATFKFYTDTTKATVSDLSGYTSWAAEAVAPSGAVGTITVDHSLASTGIISVTFTGSTLTTFPNKGARWELQATTADSRPITVLTGALHVKQDVFA